MAKTILFPTDFSTASDAALEHAAALAKSSGAKLLIVHERACFVEVAEVPDECPVLIGQVPIEMLDFVVDPVGQKLIGNPAHGGQQMIDLLYH